MARRFGKKRKFKLNAKALSFQKRRKTKPMTRAECNALVEAKPGDYERGLAIHAAMMRRLDAAQETGSDVGKEEYLNTVESIMQERIKA